VSEEVIKAQAAPIVTGTPLCVDLDGTLLQTDTLHEGALLLLKKQPLALLKIPIWLIGGRAALKREITRRIEFDIATLPVNEQFLEYLVNEHKSGRHIILVTAADERVAQAIAGRFEIFNGLLSSDGASNLSGEDKAAALSERFGRNQFDYAGNAPVDLPVWAAARRAIVVNAGPRTLREAKKVATVEAVFEASPKNRIVDVWRALRVHQWSKNFLLFIPLLGAHKWNDPQKVKSVVLAFVCFNLCASSVYILNDLLDLTSDRRHPSKRLRAFASGKVPISTGVFIAPLLLIAAFSLAVGFLPWAFVAIFAFYYVLTFSYSLRLKQIALIDVFVLASLYGLRILAGGFAGQVAVSDWLLVLSLFLFLSLAFVKRFTELGSARLRNRTEITGRGYSLGDDGGVSQMGVASGYIAVVILALYITNPLVTQLYLRPMNLLLACPLLLYWISRIWLLARRQELHEDPVVFAFTDRQSWLIGLGLILVVFASGPR
jgi:4-hydroxybenzoate polyprenyltransferase